ncbi:hypothetical protein B0H19DRAFT_1181055 [Mycena capillaripes]|nr:hypothetical protein B0H19DRAFT_1181055 [Mycena capillaripes]
MKRLLGNLTRKRDELTEYIDAHLALVSPMRRLPEDVIRAIFIACMPSKRNAVMSPEDTPLLLCQICSSWRQIALATPLLWASLHIVVPVAKIDQLIQAVRSWLSRSGVLPLSISLVPSRALRVRSATDEELLALLSSLVPLSGRWRRIRMIVRRYRSFEPFAQFCPEDFPLLRTASVGTFLFYEEDLSASPWQSLPFLDAAGLRRLSIAYGYRFSELQKPWAQLTHLNISGIDHLWPRTFQLQTALAILRQCRALQTCAMRVDESDPTLNTLTPVSLPYLWHLAMVNNMGESPADDFFKNLVLPKLRSLEYTCYSPDLPRSALFPALERVSLTVDWLSTAQLIDFLRLLPLLSDLELMHEPMLTAHTGPLDPDFLLQFAPDSELILCPSLRRLKLSNFRVMTDDTLLAFIQTRTSGSVGFARLEAVNVHLLHESTLDLKAALRGAVDSGLQLSLQYAPIIYKDDYSPWERVDDSEEGPDLIA